MANDAYEVRYEKSAMHYFKKIRDKNLTKAFTNAISRLAQDPYIGTKKKGDLSAFYGYDVYYAGVNYELAYKIIEKDGKYVLVVFAGTRENFYDQLRRLL